MTSEPQMPSHDLPKLELYTLKELEEMALHVTLNKMGIANPRKFLVENEVKVASVFKQSVGMGITILSIAPNSVEVKPLEA